MLGKLKSMISRLRDDLIDYAPIKGLMLAIEGNGASDPTIITGYNIDAVTRTGVGVYEVTLVQNTFYGIAIGDVSVSAIGYTIAPTVTTELYAVSVVSTGALTFDIEVSEVTQGTGNKLDIAPYDIVSGDSVSAALYMNLGGGELPPA